jgi:hypothetical protein
MKTTTTRHYHLRKVKSRITPVRQHSMNLRKFNRFERGSGSYKCQQCGRLTRKTGYEGNLPYCKSCCIENEIENMVNDGYTYESIQECYNKDIKAIFDKFKR